jgi:hypothetical protein
MALVGCDGFDSYAATADLTKKWYRADSQWTWSSSAGKFGGGCAVGSTTAGGLLVQTPGVITGSPNCMGFWGKFGASLPSANSVFAGLAQGNGAPSVAFQVQTSGKVFAFGSGSMSGGTGTSMCDGLWHWYEILTNNGFNGTTQAYVDGVLIASGANGLSSGTFTNISFQTVGNTALTLDDCIAYDSTTGAPTNSNFPLGPRQITTLRPTSDGVCSFATLSSGATHFSLVNEVNPDGDTTYVEDSTSGHQDLLNFASLAYNPSVINAVMLNAYLENPYGGAINNQLIVKSVATTTTSASGVTPINYATRQVGFGADPNTSAAWTSTGLNAAQFGYKNP